MTPFYTSMAVLKLDELPSATAEQCKEKCKSGCLSVEWWEKMRLCYECTDPSKKTAYTNTKDLAYPFHVFLKDWSWTVLYNKLRSQATQTSSSSSSSSSPSTLTTSLFTLAMNFESRNLFYKENKIQFGTLVSIELKEHLYCVLISRRVCFCRLVENVSQMRFSSTCYLQKLANYPEIYLWIHITSWWIHNAGNFFFLRRWIKDWL